MTVAVAVAVAMTMTIVVTVAVMVVAVVGKMAFGSAAVPVAVVAGVAVLVAGHGGPTIGCGSCRPSM